MERAFEVGATDFFPRPTAPALLTHRLRFVLRMSAALEEARHSEARLAEAGFVDIRVTPKAESREIISTWAPGTGIEEFVVSAMVEARKP